MPEFTGGCYCRRIRYSITLDNPDADARTSICHCTNCKKFTGSPHGTTTKLARSAFEITLGGDLALRTHEADNGSGTLLTRQFCQYCGSGILEFGANAGENVYVFYGTFDREGRKVLKPRGEFFVSEREGWLAAVEGTFQKQKIFE